MKKIIITLSILFSCIAFECVLVAQPSVYHQADTKSERESIAVQQIRDLKKGVLLVRLRASSKTIKAYEERGFKKKAEETREKLFIQNKKLMKTLKKSFNFCPVYFFYSSDTKALQNGEMQGRFLNESLQKDASIELDVQNTTYLILELTSVLEPQSALNNEEGNNYHRNTTLSRALVIKDTNFEQLRDPFPYAVASTFDRLLNRRVRKLNGALHGFYRRYH